MDQEKRRSIVPLALLLCAVLVFVGIIVVSFVNEDNQSVSNGNVTQQQADSILKGDNEDLLSQLNNGNANLYSDTGLLPSFSGIVDVVSPAVVRIDVNSIVSSQSNSSNVFPFFGDLFEVPQQYEQSGTGSGFIISKEGHIVTNHHVVDGATSIRVTLTDGNIFDATLVGSHEASDVAIIKINVNYDLPVAPLGSSSELSQGDWVLAIGNPYGLFDHTVTSGIVSALGRSVSNSDGSTISIADLIQTNAAINQGNSGGPLINMKGEVIGINTAIIPYAQGIGFAIAIDGVKDILNELLVNGEIITPWLGVSYTLATPAIAQQHNLPDSTGIFVVEVMSGSPAEKGGIKANDLIKKVNGQAVTSNTSLSTEIKKLRVGDNVTFEVWRGEERLNITVMLEAAS